MASLGVKESSIFRPIGGCQLSANSSQRQHHMAATLRQTTSSSGSLSVSCNTSPGTRKTALASAQMKVTKPAAAGGSVGATVGSFPPAAGHIHLLRTKTHDSPAGQARGLRCREGLLADGSRQRQAAATCAGSRASSLFGGLLQQSKGRGCHRWVCHASAATNGVLRVGLMQQATAAALLVAVFFASYSLDLGIDRQLLVCVVRAFVQLTAVGALLQVVFTSDALWPVLLAMFVMIAIGGRTAGSRAKAVPNSHLVATAAVAAATCLTLTLVAAMGVVPLTPRGLIPIAGIIAGSAMTFTGNTMMRLADDMKQNAGQIEAALALGASPFQAAQPFVKKAFAIGIGPSLDYTKTVGLVQLPGGLTGMILGGASPMEAAGLQIVIIYLLLTGCFIGSLMATRLSASQFFTKNQQLIS